MAQAFLDEFNATLDIHSPSRKAMWSGQMVGMGVTTGIENTIGTVKQAAANLGLAALPTIGGTGSGGVSLAGVASTTNSNTYNDSHDISFGSVIVEDPRDAELIAQHLYSLQSTQDRSKGGRGIVR